MKQYNKEELIESLNVIDSTIRNCEKIHPKFSEWTSQHTLLKNRIKALYISKALMNKYYRAVYKRGYASSIATSSFNNQ